MNSHNLESDISITTVYTQQIMAQFHDFKPFQRQREWEFCKKDLDVLSQPRLSCKFLAMIVLITLARPSLGRLNSNILIRACFVSSSILSRLHIWIGEEEL